MIRSPIRTIHVVPSISEEASGPSYSVLRLCNSIESSGAEVRLAALDWAPLESPPDILRTFRIGTGPRRIGRSPEMSKWLREKTRTKSVDVIHSHILWQMNSIYPSRAVHKTETKLIVSPRGSLSEWAMSSGSKFKRLFWPALQRPAISKAHCIHATAEQEYDDVRRLGFRQPVCITPNGIDIPDQPDKSWEKRKDILYLGRLHPKKGIDNLLHAWSQLDKEFPSWNLLIAGPSESYGKGDNYARYLQSLINELRLDNVQFLGALYGSDKFDMYRRSSLFVLPTHSENFGLTVAEALASSTPAIVTKGAPWEGLNDHRAGWSIDIGVRPLVETLRNAMRLPAKELSAMGSRGRDWMIEDFSWEEIGRDMFRTYEWLLHGGQKPDHVILD